MSDKHKIKARRKQKQLDHQKQRTQFKRELQKKLHHTDDSQD